MRAWASTPGYRPEPIHRYVLAIEAALVLDALLTVAFLRRRWRGLFPALLCDLLADLPAHVNLIPHNPFEGSPLRPPEDVRVERFRDLVHAGGVRCLVRWPRGRDIAAACGQLALQNAI